MDEAAEALRYMELRVAKIKFYSEVLGKMARQGNQVIAQMHGALQGQLVREGAYLPSEDRGECRQLCGFRKLRVILATVFLTFAH